jgi:hypothetical protein
MIRATNTMTGWQVDRPQAPVDLGHLWIMRKPSTRKPSFEHSTPNGASTAKQSQFSVAPALTPLQYFRAAIDTTREP